MDKQTIYEELAALVKPKRIRCHHETHCTNIEGLKMQILKIFFGYELVGRVMIEKIGSVEVNRFVHYSPLAVRKAFGSDKLGEVESILSRWNGK